MESLEEWCGNTFNLGMDLLRLAAHVLTQQQTQEREGEKKWGRVGKESKERGKTWRAGCQPFSPALHEDKVLMSFQTAHH